MTSLVTLIIAVKWGRSDNIFETYLLPVYDLFKTKEIPVVYGGRYVGNPCTKPESGL